MAKRYAVLLASSIAADRAIYPSPEGGDALGSVRVGDFGSGR